MMLGRWI